MPKCCIRTTEALLTNGGFARGLTNPDRREYTEHIRAESYWLELYPGEKWFFFKLENFNVSDFKIDRERQTIMKIDLFSLLLSQFSTSYLVFEK